MKNFLISILLLIFFVFFQSKIILNPRIVNAVDKNAIIQSLTSQANCGKIGLACCKIIQIPSDLMRIEYIDIPVVGSIINPLITYANNILSITDNLINGVIRLYEDNIKGNRLCGEGRPSDVNNLNNCSCLPNETFKLAVLCTNISKSSEKTQCINCSKRGVWTALGCIDFKFEGFIKNTVFGFGIGLAGVIAFLCIIYSAFMLQTSSGNPERIKKAQEMLTSCIMGLMLIIFSVFILKLIGVDILKIPGFG